MTVVTLEEFEAATLAALAERIGEEEARSLARKAMNYFGFDDTVVDNTIPPKDRDIFYLLEEVGLVTTLEDETYVEKGKKWRIHYWVLNKEKIRRLACEEDDACGNGEKPESVYKDWDEDWTQEHQGKDI
ncbi:MAG: hypothetical protein QCI38_08200 [Candidatus Thermoplasmatota archaeon]|nr:hypothetical protein [Candidatus Thermoplasmatota archaeon]